MFIIILERATIKEDFSLKAREITHKVWKIIWEEVPALISKTLDEKLPALISKAMDGKLPAILDALIKKNYAEFFEDRLHPMSNTKSSSSGSWCEGQDAQVYKKYCFTST